MNPRFPRWVVMVLLLFPSALRSGAASIGASFSSGADVPVTVPSYVAAGNSVALSLSYAPATGTELTVVRNTGSAPILGEFSNLAQGQLVALTFGGVEYRFAANYAGGTGNDLVLAWAGARALAWGDGNAGQLGTVVGASRLTPGAVVASGALAGKTVVALAAGAAHTLALCSDGSLAAWGQNDLGQLGDGTTTARFEPVAVPTAGTPLASRQVVAIAVGESHTLALCSDGALVAWGANAAGQLGDGTTTPRATPTFVPTVGTALENRRVVAIAAGRHHSLALCADGTIAAWGLNAYGQLGDGTTTDRRTPTAVVNTATPLATSAPVALAAGGFHSLALLADGTVAAWGQNASGQIGDGTGAQQTQPVAVSVASTALTGKTVVALAAGGSHSLALCADGTLAAWGSNTSGQLGDNSGVSQFAPVAVIAAPGVSALGGRVVRALAAGAAHSVALCTDGSVVAWGLNSAGQLGDASVVARALPVVASAATLPAGAVVVRVASGVAANHTLAAVALAPAPEIAVFDGADNTGTERQSGSGTFTFPTTAVGGSGTTQTFTVQNTGGVTLTGLALSTSGPNAGDYGVSAPGATSLAPGAQTSFTVTFAPSAAGARSAVVRIASDDADENPFLIAVTGNDPLPVSPFTRAYTWGTNEDGALGNVGVGSIRSSAGLVRSLGTVLAGKSVVSIGSGWNFTVALAADGTLASWGRNNYGQLGQGTTTAVSFPQPVAVAGTALAGRTVASISVGVFHTLALCTDGTIVAWGENSAGSLGDGTTTNRSSPVAVVTAGTPLAGRTVVSVVAANSFSLALCSDGTVVAWGSNWTGQLGDNTATNRLTPVAVAVAGTALAGKTVVALAAGQTHSLALCSDGTVAAWGYNTTNELGDGTTTTRRVPTAVATTGSALAGKSVVAIAGGANHSLALCSDGSLVAWGNNSDGQLGDGAGLSRATPFAVAVAGTGLAGKTITALAAGRQHSLALCSDGTAFAWGRGALGQLGSGNTTFQLAPVPLSTTDLPPGARFVALASGVYSDHSQGIVAAPAYADIGLFLAAAGTEFPNTAAAYSFAQTPVAGATTQTFAIANTGTAPLTGLALSKLGTDAADFLLGPLTATTLAPDATLTFTVTFSPAGPGPRLATLRIASDDADENPFAVALSGTDGTLLARFSDGTETLVSAGAYTATGKSVDFALNFAPPTGTTLTVIRNTGLDFIDGTFANLAQGQLVALNYGGEIYNFIANYFGGTGNDLVLEWAGRRLLGWGLNANSQLGDGTTTAATAPIALPSNGVLAGRTVLALAVGKFHTLALCSDGTIAAWGLNTSGQLGDGSTTARATPVAVVRSGAFATKTVAAIEAGANHSLAVCTDGTVFAWGSNSNGQLGDGTTTARSVPTAVLTTGVLSGKKVVGVVGGNIYTIARCADGSAVGWGYSANGQLGWGSSSQSLVPVAVATSGVLSGRSVISVSSHENHTLALCSDGTAVAWGFNPHGQLGDGTTSSRISPVAVVTAGTPLAGQTLAALQAGDAHSLALATGGTLAAWGYNNSGQLGDGTTTNRSLPRAPTATGTALEGRTPVALTAGMEHTLVLCSDGALVAWGRNDSGQLGDGGTTTRGTAGLVSLGVLGAGEFVSRVRSGAGANHSFAFTARAALGASEIAVHAGLTTAFAAETQTGAAARDLGRWQVGTSTAVSYTIRNTGSADLTGLALTKTGTNASDFTFGALTATTLAPGATTTFTVTFAPSAAGARTATVQIASNDTSEPTFAIALSGTGVTPLAATFNAASDIPATASSYIAGGNSVNLTLNFAPVAGTQLMVVKNTGPAFISGAFTNLAQGQVVTLSFSGNAYRFVANYHGGTGNDLVLAWADIRPLAWGRNSSGQVGDGTTTNRYLPAATSVAGALAGQTVVAQVSGEAFTLALGSDGTLFAWGDNSSGQLGDGSTTPRQAAALVPVAGTALAGKRVVAIAAGRAHALALASDGTVAAWGDNALGQLGDGTTTARAVPTAVSLASALNGKIATGIAAGNGHSLALLSDGTLATWGDNSSGQLGDATTTQRLTAVAVPTVGSALFGRTVASIAAGSFHNLALCTDGTLVAWGWNFYYQLGDGTTVARAVPTGVITAGTPLAGRTIAALGAGYIHSLALCTDGTLAVWGDNANSQLGNGTNTGYGTVPTAVTSTGTALQGRTPAAIAVGGFHNLVLCTDGTLAAWGRGSEGQIGDNAGTRRATAVAVNLSTLRAGERIGPLAGGTNSFHALALAAASPAPEVALFEGSGTAGTERLSGSGTFSFATTTVGATSSAQTFTIQNSGTASLTGLALSKTGANTGDFLLGALGASSLAPGATTTFTVTFQPAAAGARTATVQLASNDADENPFTIALAGTGGTALDAWRNANFGMSANTGSAANLADPDGDGLVNLVEFALNLDPLTAGAANQPATSATASDWVFSYQRPSAISGVTFEVQVSTDLVNWSTTPVTSHAMVSSSGDTEVWQATCARSVGGTVFFRLKITAQ